MINADFEGFLQARDGRIVTGRGEPVVLRGVGLGNWLLPEGYMWTFADPWPQSPREIEAYLADLVGADRAAEFWYEFRERFITRDDMARIAAEGMNHVRVPLNARLLLADDGTLIENGFELVDRLIQWCRAERLWVVLDLHGAPGGQTGTNIDDSLGTPALFENEHNRELTRRLWRALAERYRDESVVAAYDLLNEPLPNEYQYRYHDELVALYRELTAAVREVDPHHLIMYEGSHWATNWTVFTEIWDDNSVLQFHKYWSPPDRPMIQTFLDTGARLGLPIYMGEGGENNLDWLQTAFQLYEDHGIGWNLWPWKKIETLTSPCSVVAPEGWADIVAFAAGGTDRPDAEAAWKTLRELLDNFDLDRCQYRSEVVSAVLRRTPLRLAATGFGFRGAGVSYQFADPRPLPGFRDEEPVAIQARGGAEGEDLIWHHTGGAPRAVEQELLVRLGPGDWVAYQFQTGRTAPLDVLVGVVDDGAARNGETPISISVDGEHVGTATQVGEALFYSRTSENVAAGWHTLRITGVAPETLLRCIQIA